MRLLSLTFIVLLLPLCAVADDAARMPVPGDCAAYREGGEGYMITKPTYWLRGTITEVYTQRRRMEVCPVLGKPPERYTREDWVRMTAAYPCVSTPDKVRDVDAIRIRLRVDAWETPWTNSHGHNGRLYRGRFVDTELKQGVDLDVDGSLLERCEVLR